MATRKVGVGSGQQDSHFPGLDVVFAHLAKWRPLPGYSVERRIDLLLSPYLPRFLSSQMANAPVTLFSAEFPIPKRLVGGDRTDRRHVSADFLCLRRGVAPAWLLVELKTDAGSRREVQDRAYEALSRLRRPMSELLDAILAAKKGTQHAAAYARLVRNVRREKVDPIELCYVEPGDRRRGGAADRGSGPWHFGLGELAHSLDLPGDPLWRHLQRTLRAVARSEKGRRARG